MANAAGQRRVLGAANAIDNGGVARGRSSSTNREGAFRGRRTAATAARNESNARAARPGARGFAGGVGARREGGRLGATVAARLGRR